MRLVEKEDEFFVIRKVIDIIQIDIQGDFCLLFLIKIIQGMFWYVFGV